MTQNATCCEVFEHVSTFCRFAHINHGSSKYSIHWLYWFICGIRRAAVEIQMYLADTNKCWVMSTVLCVLCTHACINLIMEQFNYHTMLWNSCKASSELRTLCKFCKFIKLKCWTPRAAIASIELFCLLVSVTDCACVHVCVFECVWQTIPISRWEKW